MRFWFPQRAVSTQQSAFIQDTACITKRSLLSFRSRAAAEEPAFSQHYWLCLPPPVLVDAMVFEPPRGLKHAIRVEQTEQSERDSAEKARLKTGDSAAA